MVKYMQCMYAQCFTVKTDTCLINTCSNVFTLKIYIIMDFVVINITARMISRPDRHNYTYVFTVLGRSLRILCDLCFKMNNRLFQVVLRIFSYGLMNALYDS